ncbi:tetratricopeptide repeat-containing sensor histidine kinase [Hugenholtzia roseola]|uniref:tetratricopeptide repeat-containing sensor histidine kinase n=1 Tax=Hugenholtzia roseola TaxID=1002 RepID=UPI00047D23D1|nr:tetratricopeptide repeat protein [Hugenholtzia roseola]
MILRKWLFLGFACAFLFEFFFLCFAPKKAIAQENSQVLSNKKQKTQVELAQTLRDLQRKLEMEKNDSIKLLILTEIFSCSRKINPDTALYYAQRQIALAQKVGSVQGKMSGLVNAGLIYRMQGKYEKTYESYLLALSLARTAGHLSGETVVLNNLGATYQSQGIYNKALQYYQQSLDISLKELKRKAQIRHKNAERDSLSVGSLYNNIGSIYFEKGFYDKAMQFYRKALEMRSDDNLRMKSKILNNLAVIYEKEKQYKRALEYHQEALALREKLGDLKEIAQSYNNIGIIYKETDQDSLARLLFDQALRIRNQISDQKGLSSTLNNIGTLYEKKELYDEALSFYNKSLKIRREDNDQEGQVASLKNISLLYQKKGNAAKSNQIAKEALAMAEKIGAMTHIERLNEILYVNAKTSGREEEALKYLESYTQTKDSISNLEKTKTIAQLQILYETERKEQLIKELRQQNEIQQLQAERTRSYFVAAGLGLLSVALMVIFAFVRSNLRKKSALLELRLQNLEIGQELAQAELKAIKSQMNPHFIFNALNSIQSFIFLDDKRKASIYLSKFAQLMRLVLEMSDAKAVSLKDELTALRLYLDFENMRMNNDLKYTVQIDENISEHNLHIPPMIIQPYVENAIKHGLLHKKTGDKNLEILFQLSNDQTWLEVCISDNGIGREKAAEIKAQSKNQHKSFATQANQKRLLILGELAAQNLGKNGKAKDKTIADFVRIIDLHDARQNPIGTRVELRLPI